MRRFAGGALVLLCAALTACSIAPTEPVPGYAQPAASAEGGVRIPDGGSMHNYNGINMVLPRGWRAEAADNCVAPRGSARPAGEGCAPNALRIRPDPVLDGLIDRDGSDLDDPDAYRRPYAACRADSGGTRPKVTSSEVTGRGEFTLVSGEQVDWAEWTVACRGGDGFRTLVWFIPESDLEFDVPRLELSTPVDDYDLVVRSVDLSRYN
ncbi:hypothetical protein CLV63_13235 [Murinocardiopsis flavida]|uniref:Uncharacterized protein n=1 Tax=Murinocardiopsis flavida TaxID=645275 RepID=A0A2P8CR01_9ACTN|nr:hypothetical protein [Murinocardiopsis flavida]PSK87380.1 hypothetical protein CLV63_13235 [Murinocardiopsis flavida]